MRSISSWRTASHRCAWISASGSTANERQRTGLGGVSQAREQSQHAARFDRQPVQLPGHEVRHVVRVFLGVDAIEVPGPSRLLVVEGEQALLGEHVEELDHEERVTGGLVVHEMRERSRVLGFAAKRIRDELR